MLVLTYTEYLVLYLVLNFERMNVFTSSFSSSMRHGDIFNFSLGWKNKQKIKPPKRWNVHRDISQLDSRFGGDRAILCSFPKCLKKAFMYGIGYPVTYLK